MSKKHLLVIDGENILHQSFHKFSNLRSSDGKPSGAIFGFFKSLHYYVTRFNPDKVMVTFDNGRSPERLKILPNYKGHRKNISIDYESLQKQKKVIHRMLGYLGIPYIFDKKQVNIYEGDDYLAWVVDNTQDKVTIVSSDKDFNQLISKRVKILNPRKDEIVNLTNCKSIFGYEPFETVSFLSLVGDTSDDIPGYPGIGPVKARKLLDEYGTVSNAISMGKDNLKEVWERNRFLIDIRYFLEKFPLSKKDLPIHVKKINLDKFRDTANKYSLKSFLTDMFIEPFKSL